MSQLRAKIQLSHVRGIAKETDYFLSEVSGEGC